MHDLPRCEKEQDSLDICEASITKRTTSDSEGPASQSDEERIESIDPEDIFPEGGLRACLVVASAFLLLFPSYGLMDAIGTLQDYWLQHQLADYTASHVGWIANVFVFFGLGLQIFFGPIFDRYGPRWIAVVGSVGFLFMIFVLAEYDRFWQMLLCCSLLRGVSISLLMSAAQPAVAHWFKVRRGTAQGFASAGVAFGGLLLPLILKSTLPKYGYAWSLRILGFVFLFCPIISSLLMKTRLPPSPAEKKRSIISPSIFRSLAFSLFTLFVFGFELVCFRGIGMLPTYATMVGNFPPDTGFCLLAVCNGASGVGNVLAGPLIAKRIGEFNTMITMMDFNLLCTLGLWLPFGHTSLVALYWFAALFGFGSGGAFALTGACVGKMRKAQEYGRYYGTMYSVASFATLAGMPLSGAIAQKFGVQAMVALQGSFLVLSLTSLVLSRWALLGRRWAVKVVI
ncbi:MFS general substrate transporter [Lentithecium fluviatile CBS 122367]|uniref:MFS general substrate transporter n=1 Tax=Lentithecium fluviatile CBS 122367 TaxID=1168545 RepID=A0A6G1JBN0_9PLEO|nr:MFS general substrate transporter [Lentithecium fluviatile CBS 122367]